MCTLQYKKYVFLRLAVFWRATCVVERYGIYIGNIIVLIRRLSICKELYTLYKKLMKILTPSAYRYLLFICYK